MVVHPHADSSRYSWSTVSSGMRNKNLRLKDSASVRDIAKAGTNTRSDAHPPALSVVNFSDDRCIDQRLFLALASKSKDQSPR